MAWNKGDNPSPQEQALIKAFEPKVGTAGGGMAKWLDELLSQMNVITENSRQVEEKYQVVLKCQQEIAKAEIMMKPPPRTAKRSGTSGSAR